MEPHTGMNGGFSNGGLSYGEKHGNDSSSEKNAGGLDEDAFAAIRTFDAFPKTKPSYTATTSRGGQWTLALIVLSACLAVAELGSWWSLRMWPKERHHFSVERGVGHELQLNLDIVVAMQCDDLHVNVQDAAMDRILAGEMLTKERTSYAVWDQQNSNKISFGQNDPDIKNLYARQKEEEEDTHVGHVLGHMRTNPRRKFAKAPRVRGHAIDACRIYGSLEGNKVQGDFHITARGHGYMDAGPPGVRPRQHLDHKLFNFSHQINELSFGPHYPGLLNPLDRTSAVADQNMYKYQYFLSLVPTIYTKRRVTTASSLSSYFGLGFGSSSSSGGAGSIGAGVLDPAAIPQPPTLDLEPDSPNSKNSKHGIVHHHAHPQAGRDRQSVFTNQYAVTSQSHPLNAHPQQQQAGGGIPGIFVKYDIEPILLVVSEQQNASFIGLLVRLVNVVSGVLVGGGWAFQLFEWASEAGLLGRFGRRGRRNSDGYLGIGHRRANGSMDVKAG